MGRADFSQRKRGHLAKLSWSPGVTAYWMGRSYLGQNLWAADVMLPSPSRLRSWAKETTLKASILYSGGQHANEVSSTSHIDKLGEQLVTDEATRALLKQVNVVLHPITNRREMAWGKLDAKDLDEIFTLFRSILIPLIGMSTITDIFERIAERRGWVRVPNSKFDRAESWEACGLEAKEKEKATWNEIMKTLHEPFEVVRNSLCASIDPCSKGTT